MNIKSIVEVLLFASATPLTNKKFIQVMSGYEVQHLKFYIDELNIDYNNQKKGLVIKNIAGGYQILALPKYHHLVAKLFDKNKKLSLSKASLEALSIIAYKQPVSKADLESIRGVECASVINTLVERGLITVKGRANTPGRPLLFATTQQFLLFFGLDKLSDLPKLKEISELINSNSNPYLFENLYEDK